MRPPPLFITLIKNASARVRAVLVLFKITDYWIFNEISNRISRLALR